jgi:drug/metabolite transporter (DMT)-like permease
LSLTAFLLILASVFLHAGWNFISKKSVPSLAFYALSCGTAALLWLWPFLFSEFQSSQMPPNFWVLTFFSVLFEILYVGGLAYAYRKSDISLVYPLARALPLLMTALVTAVFGLGSRQPSPVAIFGMVIVFIGCLLMPLQNFRDFRWQVYFNPVIFLVILAAIGTTGYTVLDSCAMQEISRIYQKKNLLLTMSYLFFIEAGISLGALLLVCCNKTERLEFSRLVRTRSLWPILTGICSSSAYVLILLAMNFVTNVSYLQAFRQLSLPIGVLAGILILKESHSAPKLLGTLTIVVGLVIVALFP